MGRAGRCPMGAPSQRGGGDRAPRDAAATWGAARSGEGRPRRRGTGRPGAGGVCAASWRGDVARRPAATDPAVELVMALLLALLGFALVVQWRTWPPTLALPPRDRRTWCGSCRTWIPGKAGCGRTSPIWRRFASELTTAGPEPGGGVGGGYPARRRVGHPGWSLPAEGPGITVRLVPVERPIAAATLLDAVQELRGAGAEAIQVAGGDGTAVRVVASTYFVDAEDGIVVDGVTLTGAVHVDGDRGSEHSGAGAEHPGRGGGVGSQQRRYGDRAGRAGRGEGVCGAGVRGAAARPPRVVSRRGGGGRGSRRVALHR